MSAVFRNVTSLYDTSKYRKTEPAIPGSSRQTVCRHPYQFCHNLHVPRYHTLFYAFGLMKSKNCPQLFSKRQLLAEGDHP